MVWKHFKLGRVLIASVLGLSAVGCGSALPPIVPVQVTVTYSGQPVDAAQVMFTSTDGRPAYGQTDARGTCKLTTINPNDGAYAGEHLVAVAKQVEIPPDQRSPDYRPGGRFSRYPETREALPRKYASPINSQLKANVKEDGDNVFSFALED